MTDIPPKQFPRKRLVILFFSLGIIAISALTADRYIHNQRRGEALAKLATLGLNHEFADGGSSNSISFYSTGDLIAQAPRDVVLRNLKTLSSNYNGGLRYGYTIVGILFSNGTPEKQLISDLRKTFPEVSIEVKKSERG
jgi:hypothetical protein